MEKEAGLSAKGWYRTLKVFYIIANILGIGFVILLAYTFAYQSPFLFLLYGTLIVLLLFRIVRSIFLYIYNSTPFWGSFLPKVWLITIGVIVLLTILAAVGNMESSNSTSQSGYNNQPSQQQLGFQPTQSAQNQNNDLNPSAQYTTYTNPRFLYSICYPQNIFTSQTPPANGDGLTFKSNVFNDVSSAGFTVYGVSANNETLQGKLTQDIGYFQSRGISIVNQSLYQNYFTISGETPTEIVYEKTLMQSDAYTPQYYNFNTFQIEYSKQSATTYASIVSTMAQCFSSTNNSQ